MPNCKYCGFPLKRGNIKVVRDKGKGKRPYRIHRRCPQARSKAIQTLIDIPTVCDRCPDKTECLTQDPAKRVCLKWGQQRGGTAGSPLQRPQDSTGGPVTVEAVLDYPTPLKYRYFITRAAAEKLKRAIKGGQVGITVEVIPVPEYFLEVDSEAFTAYVEIEFKWPTD